MSRRRKVWKVDDLAFPITLYQTGKDRFDVVYGEQEAKGVGYLHAAHELGYCLMHALTCDGKIKP